MALLLTPDEEKEKLLQATANNPRLIDQLAGNGTPADLQYRKPDQIQLARELNRKLEGAGFTLPVQQSDAEKPPIMQGSEPQPSPQDYKRPDWASIFAPKPLSTEAKVFGSLSALGAGLRNIGRTTQGREITESPLEAGYKAIQAYEPQKNTMEKIEEQSALAQYGDMMESRDPNSPKSVGLRNYLVSRGFSGNLVGRSANDIMGSLDVQQFLQSLKPVNAKDAAQIAKLTVETKLKQAEFEELGTEAERKQSLVDMINKATGTESASVEMDIDTLNKMAEEAGLHPLKLQRAKAVGGSSGKSAVYDATRRPQLSALMGKVAENDAVFLNGDARKKLYIQIQEDPNLTPEQKRQASEPFIQEIDKNKSRLYDNADRTLQKINDPEKGVNQLLSSMIELRKQLNTNPNAPGWNEITSAVRNSGRLGSWGTNAWASFNDYLSGTTVRSDLLAAIKNLNDSFGRFKSGAAIPPSEMDSFADQLGSGSFSNAQTLRSGLDRAERVLRRAVGQALKVGIDKRVFPEYQDRVQDMLPRNNQAVVNSLENKF